MAYTDANIKTIIDKTASQAVAVGTAGFRYIESDTDLFAWQGSTYHTAAEQTGTNQHNFILNKNETGTPSSDCTIQIERGTSTNASILWDETSDIFKAGLLGAELQIPLCSSVLTDTYLPRSDGTGIIDSILKQTAYTGHNSCIDLITTSSGAPFLTLQYAGFTGAITTIPGCGNHVGSDVFLLLHGPGDAGAQGAAVTGISDNAGMNALTLEGYGTGNPTDTVPIIVLRAGKDDGEAATAAIGAEETALQVQNLTTPLMTILGNGVTTIGKSGTGMDVATLFLNSGSGTAGHCTLQYKRNDFLKGAIGVVGSEAIITGSAADDMVMRNIQKILFSANAGTTAHMAIKTTGIINISNAPNYANNAAAACGGLVAGDIYTVTSSNPLQLAIVY